MELMAGSGKWRTLWVGCRVGVPVKGTLLQLGLRWTWNPLASLTRDRLRASSSSRCAVELLPVAWLALGSDALPVAKSAADGKLKGSSAEGDRRL